MNKAQPKAGWSTGVDSSPLVITWDSHTLSWPNGGQCTSPRLENGHLVCFGQGGVNGCDVSKGLKWACATELALLHSHLSPWHKCALVATGPVGQQIHGTDLNPTYSLKPTTSPCQQPTSAKLHPQICQWIWGGLLWSHIVAMADGDLCPGNFEEWDKSWGRSYILPSIWPTVESTMILRADPHPSSRLMR